MKMSTKRLGTFEWSNKPVIPKGWFAGAGFFLSTLYFTLRVLPYFTRHDQTIAYVGNRTAGDLSTDPEREKMRSTIANHTLQSEASSLSAKGQLDRWGFENRTNASRHAGERKSSGASSHLVERPLLDGMSVLLKVALVRPWASNEGDTTLEATILGAVASSAISDIDYASIQGSTLIGQAQGNADTHRVEVRFSELRTPDGKRYPVGGVALSADGQSFGIPANFSSGSAPRILGAAIGEVISTADTIATARVLQNSSDETIIGRETHQMISRTTGQAGSELSQEATKDLKSTRAVLKVESGTLFTVKLQGSSTSGGSQ